MIADAVSGLNENDVPHVKLLMHPDETERLLLAYKAGDRAHLDDFPASMTGGGATSRPS